MSIPNNDLPEDDELALLQLLVRGVVAGIPRRRHGQEFPIK